MRTIIAFIFLLGFVLPPLQAETAGQISTDYEDINTEGSTWLDKNGRAWDLTRCDLTLSYVLDMSDYYPSFKNTEWSMIGVGSGAWAWMTSGAPHAEVTNPERNDMDDKLHLGSLPNKYDETGYDVLYPNQIVSDPIGDPWNNFGIWFDRDGVAKGQENLWGLEQGATFDTGGLYAVDLVYHAIDSTRGTVFSTINGVYTGFYDDWRDGIPEYYPVGMSFSGDLTRVKIFASIWGENIKITDFQARGCQTLP